MATIINDRDKTLQGTIPRLEYAGGNYIVIEGTGEQFRPDGLGFLPASLTLTARLIGALQGTVAWSVASGNVTFTTNGNSITVLGENLVSEAAVIKATLSYLGLDYEASYTISKASTGVSPIVVSLSNDSLVVSSDSDGANPELSNASTTIVVYEGLTDVTDTWTIAVDNTSGGIAGTLVGNTYTVTALNIDDAWVDFILTKVDYETQHARFNIVKAKAGANASFYRIKTTAAVIYKDSPDAATDGTHSSVTFYGEKVTGATVETVGTLYYTLTADSAAEATTATSLATGGYTFTPATNADKSKYTFKLYNSANKTTLLDTEVIPIVFKGTNGTNGKTYLLTISGGTRSFIYNAAGTASSPTTSSAFSAGLKEDSVDVTTATYSWSATGRLSGTLSGNGAIPNFTPTVSQTYASDSTSVTLTVTYGVVTVTETVPIAISKVGDPGVEGKKSAFVEFFAWSATEPTRSATVYYYDWSDKNVYTQLTGGSVVTSIGSWSRTLSTTPTSGYRLFRILVPFEALSSSTQRVGFALSSYASSVFGYTEKGDIGYTGDSAKIAFVVTTSSSLPILVSSTTTGSTSLPSTTGATWTAAAPTTPLTAGQYLYQVDGIYNAVTNIITWGTPYLSNLKVGALSAITSTLGTVDISSSGYLRSTGKVYNTSPDTTFNSGFYLGADSSVYKFQIGSSTSNYLDYNGTDFSLKGGSINLGTSGKIYAGQTSFNNGTGFWLDATDGARLSIGQPGNTVEGTECFVATQSNITLSGVQTVDGVLLSVGDKVLVKNQTTQSQNGTYTVQSGAWTRIDTTWAKFYDSSTTKYGVFMVTSGLTSKGKFYKFSGSTSGTVGSTAITFTEQTTSGIGEYFKWDNTGVQISGAAKFASSASSPDSVGIGRNTWDNALFSLTRSERGGPVTMGVYDYTTGGFTIALTMTKHGTPLYYMEKPNPGTSSKLISCATTTNITLSGSQTVDGVSLSTNGMVVLVKNQTNTAQNGLYVVSTSGAWKRHPDAVLWSDFSADSGTKKQLVHISDGTTQKGKTFYFTGAINGTVGTTAITYDELGPDSFGYAGEALSIKTVGAKAIKVQEEFPPVFLTDPIVEIISSRKESQLEVSAKATPAGFSQHAARFFHYDSLGNLKTSAITASESNAVYAELGGYGPFTGTHDVLVTKTDVVNITTGDILVDVELIAKKDVSNTIFSAALSTIPNTSALGIYASQEMLVPSDPPAALIDNAYYQEEIINQDGPAKVTGKRVLVANLIVHSLAETHVLVNVNAVGEGQVNVCGQGGNIQPGDLIVTSSIPGKGMRQSDDIIRNYTVAKAREAATFDTPDQVKQIACIYLCG